MLPPDVILLKLKCPNSISAGAPPRTPMGSLQRSPIPQLDLRGLKRAEEGREEKARKGRGDGRIGEGRGGERSPSSKFATTPLDVV